MCTYIEERGGLNSVEGRYFPTYAKSMLNDKVVGRTKLDKTQRMVSLLCAVLEMMSYSF